MGVTTLDGEPSGDAREPGLSRAERLGSWLYTGAPGRLASFSIDLGLSLAALGLYAAKRARQRLSRIPRS